MVESAGKVREGGREGGNTCRLSLRIGKGGKGGEGRGGKLNLHSLAHCQRAY